MLSNWSCIEKQPVRACTKKKLSFDPSAALSFHFLAVASFAASSRQHCFAAIEHLQNVPIADEGKCGSQRDDAEGADSDGRGSVVGGATLPPDVSGQVVRVHAQLSADRLPRWIHLATLWPLARCSFLPESTVATFDLMRWPASWQDYTGSLGCVPPTVSRSKAWASWLQNWGYHSHGCQRHPRCYGSHLFWWIPCLWSQHLWVQSQTTMKIYTWLDGWSAHGIIIHKHKIRYKINQPWRITPEVMDGLPVESSPIGTKSIQMKYYT